MLLVLFVFFLGCEFCKLIVGEGVIMNVIVFMFLCDGVFEVFILVIIDLSVK